ncbi:hypothetical protein XENTR_v10021296 [Xenopus tropicalis]|nr:hypothetical protein XENTR_v10021296 [Xenopus tropicalis]
MELNFKLQALILILMFHSGYTLQCFSCIYGTCDIAKRTKTCDISEQCATIKAKFGAIPLMRKDCIESSKCFVNTSDTHLGVQVTATPSCCSTDFCNSAVTQSLSVVSGIAALVTHWVAKFY